MDFPFEVWNSHDIPVQLPFYHGLIDKIIFITAKSFKFSLHRKGAPVLSQLRIHV